MSWIADCSIAMAWCIKEEGTPRTESLRLGISLATNDQDLARAAHHCGVDTL